MRRRVIGWILDLAGDDVDGARRQRAGTFELVAGNDDRRPRRRRLTEHGVELVTTLGVEAGVRLVEQPQLGATGDDARQGGAPPLAGRQRPHPNVGEPPGEPEPLEGGIDLIGRGTDGRAPEPDVLGHREIGVETVGVAEQADPRADRVALGRQVEPEHPSAATHDREQTRRRAAATTSCRHRSARAATRSRRRRPRAWPRPGRGSHRERRPRRRVRSRCVGSRPWPARPTLRHTHRPS